MLAVTCGTLQMSSDMATGFGFFLPDEVPSDQFKGVDVGFLQGSRRVAHAYRRSLFQGHDLEHDFIVGLCSGRNSADLMNVLWGMSKEQAQIYRQRAAECEALAKHYEAMPLAKYFRELAEQWRQLADQTEGSSSRFKTVFGVFRR